ncbi:copper homeostasis protein CutC [Carnobacterium sp. FSL W8-0810]|uniref:copper homeostasis protein CutC n=1 Tax=Carnobacterium sp. FSL W8-0810 TaxID=2954705 RepID=UPI0030F8B0B8
MYLKEVCLENYSSIPKAIAKGATRIELCDYLSSGGTTVSKGVMHEAADYCAEKMIPLMAIIRPRSGNFVYNDSELKIMGYDLIEARNLGLDGVVFGCLTKDNWIDEDAMEQLLEEAYGLQVTFHMAFDAIPVEKQFEAINWLADRGVQRILTHGGNSHVPIEETLPHLKKLVDYAKDRILILPGGGITNENAADIQQYLGVTELHGSKLVGEL